MSYRTLELEFWRALASRGGIARSKALTAQRRKEIAKEAGKASKGIPKRKRKKRKK
jgi:hypothetical protein